MLSTGSGEQIDRAAQLSRQIPQGARQWQAYLNALALVGFEQWLAERAEELSLNQEDCTAWQPQYANVMEAVCRLRVGEFRLCLLARGTLADEVVAVPQGAVSLPDYAPHLYVLIAVDEEQEWATIEGVIRYDQLRERQQAENLQPQLDWTYEVPLSWFDPKPDSLLLYLRCLEPAAIPLPVESTEPLASLSQLQSQLTSLIPQLSAPNCLLWQVLTWEQGASLLSHPELLPWLYRLQTEASSNRTELVFSRQLSQILDRLTQSVVKVGAWLQGELDELSQSLSWNLLPTPALATVSLRSFPTLTAILDQLRSRGMAIPETARAAYRDLSLGEYSCQLSVIIWSLESVREWTLLLILGLQSGEPLPEGLKLQVSDGTEVLVEQVVGTHTEETYLYTRVVGTWDEQFRVTISLSSGETVVQNFRF